MKGSDGKGGQREREREIKRVSGDGVCHNRLTATESISGTCSLLIFRYLTKVALKSSWVITHKKGYSNLMISCLKEGRVLFGTDNRVK